MFNLSSHKQYVVRFIRKKRLLYNLYNLRKTGQGDYSIKPLDDNNTIFIHIPKCAGLSISKALFGCRAAGHTSLDEYTYIFEPAKIQKYFKFTIVRNPWDRLVSAYYFLKSGGLNKEDKGWFDEELAQYSDFDDFIKSWLNKRNIWKWVHFRPQYHYIQDQNQKVKLDFVGLFENIDEDFLYLSEKLGIKTSLPKLNESRCKSYSDYYTEETKKIVADVYSEDISLLGYNFDNSSLENQLLDREDILNKILHQRFS